MSDKNPWSQIDDETLKGRALRSLGGAHRQRGVAHVDIALSVADGETLTMTFVEGPALVFEFDTDSSLNDLTAVQVDVSGGVTADEAVDALLAAVNSQVGVTGISAFKISSNLLHLVGVGSRSVGATFAETMAAVGNIVDAGWRGEEAHGNSPRQTMGRVPLAAEVTAGVLYFYPSISISQVEVSVVDAAGVPVAWNGAVTFDATNAVSVDNSGGVDWSATDTVYVQVTGVHQDFENLAVFD